MMKFRAKFSQKALRALVPLLLLAAGGTAFAYFQATRPVMQRTKPAAQVPLVEVMPVKKSTATAVIEAMGTVTPSREIQLEAEVSGRVLEMSPSFEPGGIVAKDEEILRLDSRDYEIEKRKCESAVATARAELALEFGQQEVAREELRLLSENTKQKFEKTDLALRKPHLQQVRAELDAARADLDKAELNLNRTMLKAPFNALVTSRDVNVGSYVNQQEALGSLVCTDQYWIEAAVPLDRIRFVDFAQEGGAPVRVASQTGDGQWLGRAIRLTGTLMDDTRLAKALIVVDDPLGLRGNSTSPPLTLGDYVSVEIEGRTLDNVVDLPRSVLRENSHVWVYRDGKLESRPVSVVWKNSQRVYVGKGLESGDAVIVTDLSAAVDGMAVALAGEESGPEKNATAENAEAPL